MRYFWMLAAILCLSPASAGARYRSHDHHSTTHSHSGGGDAASRYSDQDWLADSSENDEWRGRESHRELREVDIPDDSSPIRVEGSTTCGAIVHGRDERGRQVVARVETWAPTQREALEIARDVRAVCEGGALHAEGPEKEGRRGWSVVFHIEAPRHTDLSVETVNGPVSVSNLEGHVDIRTGNGPVALDRMAGDVRVRVENGPLSVDLDGSRWVGAGLDAETRNGPVRLKVPADYSAELETGTVNGPLASDFSAGGLRSRNQWTTVKLGSGGTHLRVVTTNGPASISQSEE
jgi:hypothetical protein